MSLDFHSTDHSVKGMTIKRKRSGDWQVNISSDSGETHVDFREKDLAVGFASMCMNRMGKKLSPSEYIALRCGPDAAAKVMKAANSRKASAEA